MAANRKVKSEREGASCEKEFDEIFRCCIESALKEVLGETASQTILCLIRSESRSERIELLVDVLERTFGSGAYILEKSILEKLYSEIGKTFQEKAGYKFPEYVKEAKNRWLTKRKILNDQPANQ